MSINKTLSALALALALVACSNDEKAKDAAQDANAHAATAQQAASDATATASTAATLPASAAAAAQAVNAASTAAATATDAAAQASNSAAMATNASADAAGKAADAVQSQDINAPGFTAELIEAKRSDGVLSIKVRLKNTGAKAAEVKIYNPPSKIDAFYVQAEGKKYFVLSDTEKVALATQSGTYDGSLAPTVEPGASYTWWAKYPAPPVEVKKFSFYWPLGAPFDDVPITDK